MAGDWEIIEAMGLSDTAISFGSVVHGGTKRLRRRLAPLLVLSLLLSIAPQKALAGVPGSAAAASGMPCHATQSEEAQADAADQTLQGCPHCGGDAELPVCGCCGPLNLAGPPVLGPHAATRCGPRPLAAAHGKTLPESPAETLYRPPITRT